MNRSARSPALRARKTQQEMNRAERIYRLHSLLRPGRPVPLSRIMDQLGASRATVKRDIAYLRDFMDAPIHYDRERNGYRYAPDAPEFELPGLWFNQSELYALLASEQLLEGVQPGLLGPYIGPLKARIRRLLAESGHAADTVSTRVILQPFAQRHVDQGLFGRVSEAVMARQVLDIEYEGRERGALTRRRIHPYRLLHYRDNWYVVGWCERAGDLRTFSLDRLRHAELVEGAATPADAAALTRYLGASFGIFTGEAGAWAVLRFTAQRARWVADEQWHPDQIGQWVDGAYDLQVPYSDPRELLLDILKYGPDVEVLAPTELRELVAGRIREAAARYEREQSAEIDAGWLNL